MAYRVALTGIDRSGKSTVAAALVDRLAPQYSILKVGRPCYMQDYEDKAIYFERCNRLFDAAHSHFDSGYSRFGMLVVNAGSVMFRPTMENRMTKKFSPDLVLADRDMTLCPSTYLTYYFRGSRIIPAPIRVGFFSRINRSGHPDKIFYLDTDPEVADARITERMEMEKAGEEVIRRKWRHMHETTEDLARLREHYLEAVAVLRRDGIDITVVQTTGRPKIEIVDQIEAELRPRLEATIRHAA